MNQDTKEIEGDSDISNKSHFLTGVLLLMYGYLGVHRFYVGKYGSGAATLLLYIFNSFSGRFYFLLPIIGWVVFIFLWFTDLWQLSHNIFTDGKGLIISPDISSMEKLSVSPIIAMDIQAAIYLVKACVYESITSLVLGLGLGIIAMIYGAVLFHRVSKKYK